MSRPLFLGVQAHLIEDAPTRRAVRGLEKHLRLRGEGAVTAAEIAVFADGDSTPNVSNGDIFVANNTAATTITNFLGGSEGKSILIYARIANTTLQHDADAIDLRGAANLALAARDNVTLTFIDAAWRETARKAA